MMQEEQLVSRDDVVDVELNINSAPREVMSLSQGDDSLVHSKDYIYTNFEVFVVCVVSLNAISGGLMEGFVSPALPSMLQNITPPFNFTDNSTNNDKISIDSLNNIPSLSTTIASLDINVANVTNLLPKFKPQGSNQKENVTIDMATDSLLVTITVENKDDGLTTTTELNIAINSSDTSLNNTVENIVNVASENFMDSQMLKRSVMEIPNSSSPELGSLLTEIPEDDSIHVTEQEASWLGSLLLLGACFGSLGSPWMIGLGRKHAILLSAVPRFIGWILVAVASSVSMIYTGRFIGGISLGLITSATPIYISEVSHSSLRGSLGCLVQLGVNIGIFWAAVMGTFLTWRQLSIFGCISVCLYFVPTLLVPYSPSWLIMQGREGDARDVIRKLRAPHYPVEEELQQTITVTENRNKRNTISWTSMFSERRVLLPLSLVLLVTIVNRFSGYNAIITYCATFIHQAVPAVSPYWAAVAVSFMQIISTGAAMTVVDRWGRRFLLISSLMVMALSLLSIAIGDAISHNSGGTWIFVVSTMIYVGAYSMGIGPLTWILMGEMFPLDAREKATAVVSTVNWLAAFIVTKTYFSLETSTGIVGTCVVYGLVCFFGAICIYFLIPETKGRTLAEIEAHFSRHTWIVPTSGRMDNMTFSSILTGDVATIDTYSTFH